MLSTYQAGKVITLSANHNDGLVQLPRTFAKPMGMAVGNSGLAIATRDMVVVLLDVPSGETILQGLAMPHSPRLYDGRLFVLLSATGELVEVDPAKGSYEVVNKLPGFARGMARQGDYLFIGLSRVRQRHIFSAMPVAQLEPFAGIVIVHLPSGRLAGSIRYLNSCEEIYDVQVLPECRRPNILAPDTPQALEGLALPNTGYWAATRDKSTG